MKALLKALGPGLLFASMAIGTSHLVLSTKAGAQYGWVMVIPIILANLFKYPFFEFGIRYTTVTEKSLIEGYSNLGKTYLWVYAIITLISTFTVLAALYVVTAGLCMNLFNVTSVGADIVSLLLFLFISVLLIVGKYRFLENSLKAVITILFVALLITTVMVLQKGPVPDAANYQRPEIFNEVGILFLIGLVGWMPTAVEASGWVSMWGMENLKTMKNKPTLKIALQEFNVGYILTGILALFFMIIGWMTLYGTGTELSGSSVVFADQLVNLFTVHIGNWAYFFIAVAAFATMFSTCMTAHDAISRVSVDVLQKLYPNQSLFSNKNAFTAMVLAMAIINWLVIILFSANMGNLVGLATFASFVLAPLLGWMNLKTVTSKDIPIENQPKLGLRILTYTGMVFLTLFALYYCWMLLM
ncbi:NRAMP family divalent metal transporter [Flagellimonas zhangzhouensis]|uniref:Mn2+ and Fe2+ transporters of the NRAMP family n=1 Tax=Flagellimonas zhangzhouensis TaxID=1073328 RepID=A0A1H2X269_9FLAO|nr:divalent metal cation transporter [Allomuricauda zhangzhouensis]SDQ27269.1 Mn2+ and Fe2+ transporters of the NRAMP family [Allomuricauda zhangzhouensis]SDW86925.1 Mn2+ and Fe2+ transporters of the NRAMP family [Allomuricauda zhangzhouensis]